MKVRYKPETDTAYIALAEKAVASGVYMKSEEVAPGVAVNYDEEGFAVGVEIYDDARQKFSGAPLWEFENERALEIGRVWLAGYRAGRGDRQTESEPGRQTHGAEGTQLLTARRQLPASRSSG